jgi:hypothetical protein
MKITADNNPPGDAGTVPIDGIERPSLLRIGGQLW